MADTCSVHDDLRLIDIAELSAITGLSRATLWRHHDEGRIPAGLKIGRAVRWRLAEIRRWLDAGCPGRRDASTGEVSHGAH
jgi:predicted DNA-binding transcriptional regulator AlpA